jgi:hypothetical protein
LVAWNYHIPFLTFCLHTLYLFSIKISLLFHLFFLTLTCSCPYSYNFMLTASNGYQTYTLIIHKARKSESLKIVQLLFLVCLMRLIFIISFKLGPLSIPKRCTFSSLFLFCAYDNSVLQNFKISIPLLPHFSLCP